MLLYQCTIQDLERVRNERSRIGAVKYGQDHLGRNGPVDIAEELMDAINILGLMESRIIRHDGEYVDLQETVRIRAKLHDVLQSVVKVSFEMCDECQTDERGGDRKCWEVLDHTIGET